MKKIWSSIVKDLWILLLDIIAVNASYLLAMLIRFFMNGQMRNIASTTYLPAFWTFAPFYTVLAIAVFAFFRLYGGMWRFAGLNDMNRIIGASLITAVIHVVGTCLFVERMPISYYVIGALLQFAFVTAVRFAYRVILAEKKKASIRKAPLVPAMVIGAGETARKTIHQLEDTPFRATVIADAKSAGKTLDGIHVIADYSEMLSAVRAVFIADPNLSAEQRKEIREKCGAAGIECLDYTGYLANLGGRIPLSGLLELTKGKVTLLIDGKEQTFASGQEAIASLNDRYDIRSISECKIELAKSGSAAYVGYEAWAEQHKAQTGEDISFF